MTVIYYIIYKYRGTYTYDVDSGMTGVYNSISVNDRDRGIGMIIIYHIVNISLLSVVRAAAAARPD